MSSKLNISEIIVGHYKTLKNSDGTVAIADIFIFYLLPLFLSFLSIGCLFDIDKDLSSLLVNFGSIFTALLLSVLVLVYDQESKIDQLRGNDSLYPLKKRLLMELYYNISYSILCSLLLVLLCFFHSIIDGLTDQINISNLQITIKYDVFVATPLIVFITANLFLNIIMIVKRMHSMLTTHHGI